VALSYEIHGERMVGPERESVVSPEGFARAITALDILNDGLRSGDVLLGWFFNRPEPTREFPQLSLVSFGNRVPAPVQTLCVTSQRGTAYADTLTLEPLLSVGAAAALLSVSRRTLYRFVEAGELHPLRVGQRLRFEPADLRAYLERQRNRGSP
jgi:excisionase family DNA binding protein